MIGGLIRSDPQTIYQCCAYPKDDAYRYLAPVLFDQLQGPHLFGDSGETARSDGLFYFRKAQSYNFYRVTIPNQVDNLDITLRQLAVTGQSTPFFPS